MGNAEIHIEASSQCIAKQKVSKSLTTVWSRREPLPFHSSL